MRREFRLRPANVVAQSVEERCQACQLPAVTSCLSPMQARHNEQGTPATSFSIRIVVAHRQASTQSLWMMLGIGLDVGGNTGGSR